jgi:hypothetical protein
MGVLECRTSAACRHRGRAGDADSWLSGLQLRGRAHRPRASASAQALGTAHPPSLRSRSTAVPGVWSDDASARLRPRPYCRPQDPGAPRGHGWSSETGAAPSFLTQYRRQHVSPAGSSAQPAWSNSALESHWVGHAWPSLLAALPVKLLSTHYARPGWRPRPPSGGLIPSKPRSNSLSLPRPDPFHRPRPDPSLRSG